MKTSSFEGNAATPLALVLPLLSTLSETEQDFQSSDSATQTLTEQDVTSYLSVQYVAMFAMKGVLHACVRGGITRVQGSEYPSQPYRLSGFGFVPPPVVPLQTSVDGAIWQAKASGHVFTCAGTETAQKGSQAVETGPKVSDVIRMEQGYIVRNRKPTVYLRESTLYGDFRRAPFFILICSIARARDPPSNSPQQSHGFEVSSPQIIRTFNHE